MINFKAQSARTLPIEHAQSPPNWLRSLEMWLAGGPGRAPLHRRIAAISQRMRAITLLVAPLPLGLVGPEGKGRAPQIADLESRTGVAKRYLKRTSPSSTMMSRIP